MRVDPEVRDDDLNLFDKYAIRELTGLSVRLIEQHVAEGARGLRWTHKVGRRCCADAATVRAYLDSFRRAP